MSALIIALIIVAAIVWIGVPLAILAWWLIDRSREQTWADERPTFDDGDCPIYGSLMCESSLGVIWEVDR